MVVAMTSPRPISRPEVLAEETEALKDATRHVARIRAFLPLGGTRAGWAVARVDGVDLQRCLDAQSAFSAAEVAHLVHDTARGLDAAHERGVFHGRLMLRKLILGRDEPDRVGVTIVGFGASSLVTPSADTSTATMAIDASTVATIAPEIVTGEMVDGRLGDVYALASIAFELLAGRPVFQDDSATRLLARKVASDAPRLREVARVPVPPQVEAALARALSRKPGERHASAGELASELSRAAGADDTPADARNRSLEELLVPVLDETPGGA